MLKVAHDKCKDGDSVSREEIKRQMERSTFDENFPDIVFAEGLLGRLGLGFLVRVSSSAANSVTHHYAEGEEVYAMFDFVDNNHCQSPMVISKKRAVEVRVCSPARTPCVWGIFDTRLNLVCRALP